MRRTDEMRGREREDGRRRGGREIDCVCNHRNKAVAGGGLRVLKNPTPGKERSTKRSTRMYKKVHDNAQKCQLL